MSESTPNDTPFFREMTLNLKVEKFENVAQQQTDVNKSIWSAPRPERRFDPGPFTSHPDGIIFTSCGILGIQSLVDPTALKNPTPFSSIIVEIHGSVRFPSSLQVKRVPKSDDLPEMELAYGVYFGPDSNHNRGGIISDIGWKDKQAAYLYACNIALKKVIKLLDPDRSPKIYSDIQDPDAKSVQHAFKLLQTVKENAKLIIIKSDSKYPVYCLNENIYKWLASSSFATVRGVDRRGAPLIQELHELIVLLESRGIAVQFWGDDSSKTSVPKDLAEDALDMAEKRREGVH